MGRKGQSKRKAPKAKNPKAPVEQSSGAVSSIARVGDSAPAQMIGKGEGRSSGKGGKKK